MHPLALLGTVVMSLAAAEELPPGVPLLSDRPLETMRFNGRQEFAKFDTGNAADQSFHEVCRVETTRRPA
ncbi:MAG: hypothetical protein JJ992_06165, partial [Planctomycetes bacterium]|nr:hypothetical protein [Planctomycetota bacterium]